MNINTNELKAKEDLRKMFDAMTATERAAEEKNWKPVEKRYEKYAAKRLKNAPVGAVVYGNPVWIKPQRNAPCSCGSGKKYKRCCGAAGKE